MLAKKQKFQTKRQIIKTKKMENIKVMNALREIYKFEKDFVLPRIPEISGVIFNGKLFCQIVKHTGFNVDIKDFNNYI